MRSMCNRHEIDVKSRILLLLALLAPWNLACSLSGPDSAKQDTISRETFIEAYFRLRMRALRESSDAELSLQVRDSILGELDLTDQDLLTFVEVWGEDGEVMNDVWQVVDSLIRVERVAASDDDYEEGGIAGGDPDQRERPDRGGGRP